MQKRLDVHFPPATSGVGSTTMNVHGFGSGGGRGGGGGGGGGDDDPADAAERGGAPQAGEPMAVACGERIRYSTLGVPQYVLLCCCPCCLGPPCSYNRRTHYRNLAKTLSGVVLLACVAMMVVTFICRPCRSSM